MLFWASARMFCTHAYAILLLFSINPLKCFEIGFVQCINKNQFASSRFSGREMFAGICCCCCWYCIIRRCHRHQWGERTIGPWLCIFSFCFATLLHACVSENALRLIACSLFACALSKWNFAYTNWNRCKCDVFYDILYSIVSVFCRSECN